ncbi:MAG: NAD(P)H-dependent oxidoreductase subunit E, partial [Nitrospinaceae bacterium]|nr:NAD(P)H-dependent oxidoreductase subunit E [Nitrospinaceae bacterium]NIR54780.1 NAD(P)H-dependent oxidoreductase subunit E [Nitrospinaceae bacterium]NIS85206.1 NAD(P)H-dependent oxidoreductase subunit E [Nitrospinaceae bacterium]NIT82016.1 NAD(P)H-dependent oxidoreductase subunit E [Nitrospinaceae bacterium]NIU44280.1 NAD(P)H-dependent oxidoreductase subunit E [Nitrospinaceae bacterium]
METNEPQVETEENFPEEKPIDPGPGQDILDRLPNQSRRYLIPTLQKIQEVYRYLPASIMEMVMRKMKITRSELYGVISFYPQLRITEPGKYIIKLCYGTACFVKGAPIIGDKIYDSYHIRPGETDESKLFTLQTASCLGNCGAAPMAIIGEDTHG